MDAAERLQEIRLLIEEAVASSPHSIVSGMWGVTCDDDDTSEANWRCVANCTCPMGAVLMSKQPDPTGGRTHAAAKVLGVNPYWVAMFTQGFDGKCNGSCRSTACRLGQEFRAKLLPKEAVETSTEVSHPFVPKNS